MKYPSTVNVAVHDLLLFIVTVPSEQSASPLQPEKTEPGLGVAMRVTEVPLAKFGRTIGLAVDPCRATRYDSLTGAGGGCGGYNVDG